MNENIKRMNIKRLKDNLCALEHKQEGRSDLKNTFTMSFSFVTV